MSTLIEGRLVDVGTRVRNGFHPEFTGTVVGHDPREFPEHPNMVVWDYEAPGPLQAFWSKYRSRWPLDVALNGGWLKWEACAADELLALEEVSGDA